MECPSAAAALIESVLLGCRGCHLPMLSAGLLPHRTPANPRAHKTAFHHSRNGQMPQTPNTVHSSNICSYADSHSLPLQSWRFHIARNQLLVRFPPSANKNLRLHLHPAAAAPSSWMQTAFPALLLTDKPKYAELVKRSIVLKCPAILPLSALAMPT